MHEGICVLIVEDDAEFSDLLKEYLDSQGMETFWAGNGSVMWEMLATHSVDVLVLDLMLPGDDGLSLLRKLRAAHYRQPILVLSASGDVVDRVVGLEAGADDYLSKPAHMREVLARVRALARRGREETVLPSKIEEESAPKRVDEWEEQEEEARTVYRFGPYVMYPDSHQLWCGGEEVLLTSAEFSLLLVLTGHPNRVLTREQLMNLVMGYDYAPYDRSIDVRISRLRGKLEPQPRRPIYIRTIRNQGYLFNPRGK